MKRITWMLLCIILSSCAATHKIEFSEMPCLYPFYGYKFVICKRFDFTIDGKKLSVHKGFNTDLASIPRILWALYPPSRIDTIPGAVIHDYLYYCPDQITRSEADSIFYDVLLYKGVPKRIAFKYWLGVRFFGKHSYHKGASCNNVYSRTKNTISLMRVVDSPIS